jgi:hypothetical protein
MDHQHLSADSYVRLRLDGGEIRVRILRIYADVESPVFLHYNGNQLTAFDQNHH